LANDPGIVGIMKKHDWRIGLLEEMPPEGFVGISPVCVLGVNTGKGMKVSLRLRTDDRLGFRNYHTIRSTLLHELAHNDISEHSQAFWQLVSQLNKEVVELDWTKSSGKTTGRQHRQVWSDRLNPSERGDSSSEEDEPLFDDPDPEGYLLGGKTTGVSRLLTLSHPEPIIKPLSKPTSSTIPVAAQFAPTASPSLPASTNAPKSGGDMDIDAMPKPKRAYWKCPDCTYRNELNDRNCLSCNGLAPLLRTETFESNERANESVGMDVTEIHDPVLERSKKLERLLHLLVQSTDINSAKIALETLERIIGNLLLMPNEEKFKSVFPSNKAFFSRVARHLAALDFLREVGFVDEPSTDRLVFKRNDPGLLWMAKSSIQVKLDSFAASFTTEEVTATTTVH
jgi:hypothetical protein